MIKYNSDIGDQIASNVKAAGSTLKSDIGSKIASDFSALTSVGLFGSQIAAITSAVNEISSCFESFGGVIAENKSGWQAITEESEEESEEFAEEVEEELGTTTTGDNRPRGGGTSSPSGGTTTAPTTTKDEEVKVKEVEKGKEISVNDIKELLAKVDSSVLPVLLQKINKTANGESLLDLLTDKNKSDILTKALKNILGDTTDGKVEINADTESIQKIILDMVNTQGVDITTEEGKSIINKYLLEQLNVQVDESAWNKLLYGENTTTLEALDGKWVVAKTTQDVESYVSYITKNGVRQNANPSDWGDSCLAFAGAHTHDLYKGSQTTGAAAAGYAHASDFTDFIDDDKQTVLSKIYDEIMSGKPVVLQVNGNKQGTGRHFVTVVGFKEGVTSGATLKETDLLIVDSWDGKLERMDTSSSRFMTSGKQCGKDYSGYRLRVFKS